ncbi:MAG: threonine/serine exporter family protein [Peptostreptococcaceae bacterium]
MNTVLVQIVSVVIGTIGFSIFFNIEKSKIPSVAVGASMSWLIYLVCFEISNNIFISSLIAALAVSIYSEIAARVLKSPANIFLIPSIIPLLPGGSFYYTMSAAVSMDGVMFKTKGFETIITVLGITIGTVLGFFIFIQIFNNIKNMKYVK